MCIIKKGYSFWHLIFIVIKFVFLKINFKWVLDGEGNLYLDN